MSKANVEIYAKDAINMLSGLDQKLRNKAYRDGIRWSLNIVKKETIKNIRKRLGKSVTRHKDKYGKTLESGVKTSINRKVDGGKVHIMANYKLKWFELGTSERYNMRNKQKGKYLKKYRRTGKITPMWFFRDAYTSKEKEVFNTLEQNIAKAIKKINDKQL